MSWLGHVLGLEQEKEIPGLAEAIERAVNRVEPHLKQIGAYPKVFRKPVGIALEYARNLAASVPGPVEINGTSYVQDPFVHSLFPSVAFIQEALCSSRAMRDYHDKHPVGREIYALMGMRRWEKNTLGMELLGEVLRRDVLQNVVYFTSHTVENPSTSEELTRDLTAWSFFDRLTDLVAKRVAARKQEKTDLLHEKDWLTARLHEAKEEDKPALNKEMAELLARIQGLVASLSLDRYHEDFEAVMLEPQAHLRLESVAMCLDDMGVRREQEAAAGAEKVEFNDLIGFDRRQWTVTLVRCSDVHVESYAERLEAAYRQLSI